MSDFPKPQFLERTIDDISVCPFCGAGEADADDTIPQTEQAVVYFHCSECDKAWKRIYTFSQIIVPGHKDY